MNPTLDAFPRHWAALPDYVARWHAAHLAAPAGALADDLEERRQAALANLRAAAAPRQSIAVLPISGGLRKRASYWSLGMEDYEAILNDLAAMPNVSAIVLAIDSPGGTVDGTKRLGDAVARVNATKPVVAFADGMMASAAYWIGSQASAIVAAPHSLVGSIGVLLIHAEFSAMLERDGIKVTLLRSEQSPRKVEANPFEPLRDDVKANLTAELSGINQAFITTVQKARASLKSDDAYTGAAWTVERAPSGLVDAIGPLEHAIQMAADLAAKRAKTSGRNTAHGAPLTPAAEIVTPVSSTNTNDEDSAMSLFSAIAAKFGGDKKKKARALELASENPKQTIEEIQTQVDREESGNPAAGAEDADASRLASIRARFGKDPVLNKRAFGILAENESFTADQIADQIAREDAAELARLRQENANLAKDRDAQRARAEKLTASGHHSPVNTSAPAGSQSTNSQEDAPQVRGLSARAAWSKPGAVVLRGGPANN